jgi:hypothetical protein
VFSEITANKTRCAGKEILHNDAFGHKSIFLANSFFDNFCMPSIDCGKH